MLSICRTWYSVRGLCYLVLHVKARLREPEEHALQGSADIDLVLRGPSRTSHHDALERRVEPTVDDQVPTTADVHMAFSISVERFSRRGGHLYLRELYALSISNSVHNLEMLLPPEANDPSKRCDVRPVRMDFRAYLSADLMGV